MNEIEASQARIDRLRNGNWQFGHAGRHHGSGAPDCPKELHHHHDAFCKVPTILELIHAGVDPNEFEPRSRA